MALREQRRRQSLRERLEAHARLIDLDLVDFVPEVRASYESPTHLAPIAEFFDRVARGEVVKMLASAPPQMGKSELMGTGCAQYLARFPDRPIIYASYGADLAEQKSRVIRDVAEACGVEFRADANAVATWLTPQGGGLRARGIGGATTGNPAKLFVIDDPHKDREEAESALMQQRVFDWYVSVAETRTHPDSSILVAHARWNPGDLIGRLQALKSADGAPMFEHHNLPAIWPDGRPLWDKRPLDWLEPKKAFEHEWHSLWMGAPRQRGERVFKGIAYYDRLPLHYRVGKGIDLAYTAKTSACFSCGVVLLEDTDEPDPDKRKYFVVDVRRRQCEVRDFAAELGGVVWPGAWHWFTSTTEKGVAALLNDLGVPVEDVLATKDKFARAQPVAAAWNQGRVLVPREAPWLRAFVDEVGSFTGVSDKSDDQIDSLASAFESVRYVAGKARTISGGGSRFEEDERGFG